jgi:hypothetical protein
MRLHEVLRLVSFALGGEGGSRLLWRLGMRTSPSTLLRYVVRGSPEATHPPPYAVGKTTSPSGAATATGP